MKSKTFLVALREYMENLRTKTFWIGILAFPVLIALTFVLASIFAKAKDVRSYAVLDLSRDQWLSKEIAANSAIVDLSKLMKASGDNVSPEEAAEAAALFARLPQSHPIRRLFAEAQLTPEEVRLLLAGDRDAARTRMQDVVLRWQQSLSREDVAVLRGLDSGLGFVRYEQVPVGDLGDDPEAALTAKLDRGELFAYFVIGEDPLASSAGSRYVSKNVSDPALRDWFSGLATNVVRDRRIAELNLTPQQARSIQARFEFGNQRLEGGAVVEVSRQDQGNAVAPAVFVYLLWIAVFTAAQMLLTNTIEEKSNRIIEVLLSSVSPLQLMTGKVFGIAATGLTLVLSWALCALVAALILPSVLPALEDMKLSAIIGNPLFLGSFLLYFLLGYLLYAAVLVGIGSVCNSLKEAQNLLQPVFLVLFVPLLAMVPIVQDPNGTLAKVLTYIPLFTPFVMMNRAGGPPAAHEYVISTVLLVATVLFAFWAAAKIFRVGILMTGKAPSLREILRLFRAPAN